MANPLMHVTAENVAMKSQRVTSNNQAAWAIDEEWGGAWVHQIGRVVFLDGMLRRKGSYWDGRGVANLQLVIPAGARPSSSRVIATGKGDFYIRANGQVEFDRGSHGGMNVNDFISLTGVTWIAAG